MDENKFESLFDEYDTTIHQLKSEDDKLAVLVSQQEHVAAQELQKCKDTLMSQLDRECARRNLSMKELGLSDMKQVESGIEYIALFLVWSVTENEYSIYICDCPQVSSLIEQMNTRIVVDQLDTEIVSEIL